LRFQETDDRGWRVARLARPHRIGKMTAGVWS
jgi:hypothetical protein